MLFGMLLSACTPAVVPTQQPATPAPQEPVAPAKTTFGLTPFAETQTLRLGFFTGSPLSYPFLWADKLGYFEELNIKIEYVPFTNGPAMMESNAEWDIASCGLGGIATAMKGYDFKIVDITDYEVNLTLFARPDSDLAKDPTNPENWKGTTWVYPAGTTAQATLVSALEKLNLTLDDIESVNMDVSNALTGFDGGTGDGLAVWNAIAFAAEDKGYVRIGDAGTLGFKAPCGTVAKPESIAEKADLIETAIAVFHFTVEWLYESPENQAQAAQWYLEHCESEGLLVSESIAKRVIEWYRGPTMKEAIALYEDASPDDAGLYSKRDLLQAEKDILIGVDFFISQGRYTAEDRNAFLDKNLIDPVIVLGIKEKLMQAGISY